MPSGRFSYAPVDPGYGDIGAGIGKGIIGIVQSFQAQREKRKQDEEADFWDRAKRAELSMQGVTEGPVMVPELEREDPLFKLPEMKEARFGLSGPQLVEPELTADPLDPYSYFKNPQGAQAATRQQLRPNLPRLAELPHTDLAGGFAYTPSRDKGLADEMNTRAQRDVDQEESFNNALMRAIALQEVRGPTASQSAQTRRASASQAADLIFSRLREKYGNKLVRDQHLSEFVDAIPGVRQELGDEMGEDVSTDDILRVAERYWPTRATPRPRASSTASTPEKQTEKAEADIQKKQDAAVKAIEAVFKQSMEGKLFSVYNGIAATSKGSDEKRTQLFEKWLSSAAAQSAIRQQAQRLKVPAGAMASIFRYRYFPATGGDQ